MDFPAHYTIIVVDDDQLVRDFAVHTVQFHTNRKVTTFESGFSGWQYLRRRPLERDIVIADANIPDMDGLELLTLVKTQMPRKLFVVTASETALEQKASALGADAFLAKPYDAHDLLQAIQTLVLAAVRPDPRGNTALNAFPDRTGGTITP